MNKGMKVRIDRQGKTHIEMVGYSGPACAERSANVERMLGGNVKRDELPEMYASTAQAQQQTAGQE